MGCCCAKEAAVAAPPNDVTTNDYDANSPSGETSKSAPSASKTSKRSRRRNKQSADSSGSAPETTTQQAAPPTPSGAIPISKGERPPPGWGGTPEVEETEADLDEQHKGPRALRNVPGGNGYISGTRKDQEISEGVMDRIKGLEDAGLRTKKKMGLKMLTPRIITDVKETWDREGNITRYMTHYIEEPDGRKYTKKETLYIAAGDPDPMAPAPVAETE